ncbi:conserved hypothetical protein [Talaromyces stipitatus ATCC 10500]|uniref:BTB domain-containing protein n=1 Tax=Talaromyces stipitatus (strain ATCC 10500 / CBS 375.48 / QM 6759 / NRRL 1006) TaxID=441959 RepID=B8LXN6_TALSN|nr:uncharacterized protein TSTA_078930 [Talaromyces stipitatus ATCC 10500]EED24537.1 conserved hypothetical protein [Talaromyces stipitatus ATCC 10500]
MVFPRNTLLVPKEEGDKLLGKTVDVVVGHEHETFSIHEKLIRASSLFFDKAMSGAWQESAQNTIELPDDEPEIFGLYHHWLYYGTLPVFCDDVNVEYVNLIDAYTLGDKLLDTRFQDTAIDAIIERSISKGSDGKMWYPGQGVIEHAYNNTNESALVRTLLVDMYVSAGHGAWLRDCGTTDFPQSFLFELAAKSMDQRGGSRLRIDPSKYHIHGSQDGKKGSHVKCS